MGPGTKKRGGKHNERRVQSAGIARRAHSNVKTLKSRGTAADGKQANKGYGRTRKASKKGGDSPGRPKAKVPFVKGDRVLLVGEGDFSFALSLVQHHSVQSIVATSYDSQEALFSKYPHAGDIIQQLGGGSRDFAQKNEHIDEFHGFSPSPPQTSSPDLESSPTNSRPSHSSSPNPASHWKSPTVSIAHSIDATLLSTKHRKLLRRLSGAEPQGYTKVVFNFPHVGGLSTDVNRQTRANQQLIQGFFGAAKPLLARERLPANPTLKRHQATSHTYDHDADDLDTESAPELPNNQPGQILVTLFAGETYEDWNIRDIARSQGLKVIESFRFPWEMYPGYQHARTIGEVTTGKDRSEQGKRKGAWRGEERDARCFVFEVKDPDGGADAVVGTKRKRSTARDDSSSGSD